MAKTATDPNSQLRKRAKVVARHELRDVPEGTPGRVILINGLTWIRYWVRFDNDVYLGSINRSDLATQDEWKRHLAGEDVWGETSGGSGDIAGGDDAAGGGDEGEGGGKTTPSGTLIPQKLLDRAAAARARLAA